MKYFQNRYWLRDTGEKMWDCEQHSLYEGAEGGMFSDPERSLSGVRQEDRHQREVHGRAERGVQEGNQTLQPDCD